MAIGDSRVLKPEERERIGEAVRTAERRTRAEIVPMIVSRSGVYRDATHRAGLILALFTLTALLMSEAAWLPWSWDGENAAWLVLCTVAAYAAGAWSGTFAPIVRLITSRERMRQKVRLRAERAFAQHGIFQTRERTGILLMLSVLEREVYVLADKELIRLVSSGQWDEVVRSVIEGVRAGDMAVALCAGVSRCGEILAVACPATSGDNPNEIPDRVIDES
ncbi:conserved protein of unknown function [Nitrospira japonica]|uniref:TPM domain-containing protein n=1 Tax=Nitrospira japonica TaxID=1325564 RepID=A0A1W1I2L1_9BACT|nr:TPM domain-containing protein [Nitrospira japonica]SLM47109.1 conserved protein of unknown function [Nitrospira japonica]